MGSSAVLRSVNYALGTVPYVQATEQKPSIVTMHNPCSSYIQGLAVGENIFPSLAKRKGMQISCAKTSSTAEVVKSNGPASRSSQTSMETSQNSTFPNGFEALVLEVCDETEVAELKLKVGDFEMHLKRNIGATANPKVSTSPTVPAHVPAKPIVESTHTPPTPAPPKSSSEKSRPFANKGSEKSSKLSALEASGATGYVLVSSPTVGLFRGGKTVKGKKQPAIKEGDFIKEGRVVGYVAQFGCEFPVKSEVAGEVLKVLFKDGEPVGYGDPLFAILPSFHGIE